VTSMRGVGLAGVVVVSVVASVVLGGCGRSGPGVGGGRASYEEALPPPLSDAEREAGLVALEAAEGDEEDALEEECLAVMTAFSFVLSHESMRPHLTDDVLRAQWAAEDERLLAEVPPDLLDEIASVRAGAAASTAALGPGWLDQLDDPAVRSRWKEAEEAFSSDEVRDAAETLESYLRSCPGF
jgi:hypothetical protein